MFHRPKQEENKKPVVDKQEPVAVAKETNEVQGKVDSVVEQPPVQEPVTEEALVIEKTTETTTKPITEAIKMNNTEDNYEQQETPTPYSEKSTYGTGMQAPVQAMQKPKAFGGFPGSSSSPYASGVAESYTGGDARKLIIGRGITMSGEIESCDHLIVEGSVEAALKGASLLEISETGVFYGTVEIEQATIAGRFEGDIVVNGRLTVTSTGSITGTIVYKELAIEAGAAVDGKLSPLGSAVKQEAGKDVKTKAVAPRNDNSSGSELPFSGNVAAAE